MAIVRGRDEQERFNNMEREAKQWFEFKKSVDREEGLVTNKRNIRRAAQRRMEMEFEESLAKVTRASFNLSI